MLIDTHCHLNFKQFAADRDEVIQRAHEAAVAVIINVGSCRDSSQQAVELADAYEMIFAAVGIHPHNVLGVTNEDFLALERLAENKKVVAIGEVGLDYYDYRAPAEEVARKVKAAQADVLLKLFELAKKKQRAVIFHCREALYRNGAGPALYQNGAGQAGEDLLAIIKNSLPMPVRGVVHCFSQDKKFLDVCLDLGLYVSFTANITYKKAQNLRDLIAYAPLDRMLLETDAPYLAPQILRGRRNEPANVKILAQEIARIKKIDFEKVAAVTTESAQRLFGIWIQK